VKLGSALDIGQIVGEKGQGNPLKGAHLTMGERFISEAITPVF